MPFWSDPVTLIDSGHQQPEKYDEVYAHGFCVDEGDKDKPARILLGWEMASGPKGHNQGGSGNFFAYYNCQDQKMYTAGDKDLGSTIDLREMYNDCIINDAKSPDSRLFGYTTFPELLPDGSIAVLYSLRGRSYIANWKQDSWLTTEINVGGIITDYQRTETGTYVLLSGEQMDFCVWESMNGVTGWKKRSETTLPAENGASSAITGFIDGYQPGVQWMAATVDWENSQKDYSGKWPVYTFGVMEQKPRNTLKKLPKLTR